MAMCLRALCVNSNFLPFCQPAFVCVGRLGWPSKVVVVLLLLETAQVSNAANKLRAAQFAADEHDDQD